MEASSEIQLKDEAKWSWSAISLIVIFWSLCTIIVTASSFFQKEFFNSEFMIPFLIISSLSGFLFSLASAFYENLKNGTFWWWGIYFINSLLISSLMISINWNQSMFLLLHLVNIIGAGLSLRSRGSYIIGLIALIGYNFSLLISNQEKLIGHLFTIVVNDMSLVMISILSGQLSLYLDSLGIRLNVATRDFKKIKNLHELILSQIPSGVLTIDSQGNIIQGNSRAKEILGPKIYDNEFEWKKIYKTLIETKKNNSGAIEIFLDNELGSRRTIRCQRATIRFGDKHTGDSIQRESSQSLSYDGNRTQGDIDEKGEVFVLEDISLMRELEENLRNHEKLAAVGKLAAGIAHEIRNPLASISGSVQMLSHQAGTEEDKRLFNIVIRETDRLNLLISEFLDYAKPLPPPTETISLSALMDEVLELVSFNQKLRTDVKKNRLWSGDYFILGYKDKLKQALLNIIINAYQAMEKSPEPSLNVSINSDQGLVILKIRDSGSGMADETRKRIFEPFYTTKSKGTGLGLAVTHKIFEAHGASIIVESEIGKGTEFVIKIKEADSLKLTK